MMAKSRYSLRSFSHTGQREENQDRFCVLEDRASLRLLIVVADGMGGHEKGAMAAQSVIDTVKELWALRLETGPEEFLQALASESHQRVRDRGREAGVEPRTTLAALYVFQQNGVLRAVSIHAGDSRISQYSDRTLVKQSVDHSLAQVLVFQGKISQDELATHPDKSKVISSIGGEEEPDTEITRWDLNEGNRFTVCSDGFWESFNTQEVLELFDGGPGKKVPSSGLATTESIEKTFDAKLAASSKQDNTTVILLELAPMAPKRVMSLSSASPFQKIVALFAGLVGFGLLALAFLGNYDSSEIPPRSVDTPLANTGSESGSEEGSSSGGEGAGNVSQAEDEPSVPDEGSEDTEDSRTLDNLNIDVEISVADDEEVMERVTEILVNGNRLGASDELVIAGDRLLGEERVIRLQQTHQGIPVFGAEVVSVESNGSLINISGATGSDIAIDATPSLGFREALDSAAATLDATIEAEEEGLLVIFGMEGIYHLAWIAVVTVDDVEERLVVDAHDGSVLSRMDTRIGGLR